MTPAPPDPPEPGSRLGGWRLDERIGQGGMGVVYAATASDGSRRAVVKALRPDLALVEEHRARFAREVRALQRIDHPNLLSLVEADPDAPLPYLVVERVEGTALSDYVRDAEAPIKERVRLLADAAGAVAVLHAAGIVHRDLKPTNILVRADGEPVVIDFGLARIRGEDLGVTRGEQAIGTPRYMAPEQIDRRAGDIGPWTDVYQLGAVLHFLLADRPPYADDDTTEVYRKVRSGKRDGGRPFRADAPRVLEPVVRRAMAFRPAHRFGTAADLADELARFVRGEPLLASGRGWTGWLRRMARRRP